MCGIFGVLSNKPVVSKIIQGLHKLEYRGYDSSGISLVVDQKIQTIRAKGKLINLKKKLSKHIKKKSNIIPKKNKKL